MSRRGSTIVVLGLSLSSSWGNGHATTYRALLRGLAGLGHRVLFLERDVPWYAEHRDLPQPDFCELAFYHDLDELERRFGGRIAGADAVLVGSYVPEGIAVLDLVLSLAGGVRAFYDIDTPVTLAALERGDCAYLSPAQIGRLDLYLSFSGGPVLRRLSEHHGARAPRAFYCAVDETRYRPESRTPQWTPQWDLGYLGTYSPDRQPALERLLLEPARRLPDRRFVVAGPQYPDDIAWPANVERIEHLPPSAHAGFYAGQRFTLNVTRADMIAAGWSPSVRLFEAAACGTPIISDRWEGLAELLPDGEAIRIADSSEAVVDILVSPDEAGRQRIASRAMEIVLAGHTGTARAGELERYLGETLLSIPPPARAAVLALNNAHATELSWLDAEPLEAMLRQAFHARRIGRAEAFLLAFDPHADYASPNYLWFRGRYESFVYVDRVVVAPALRKRGHAGRLYADLIAHARARCHRRIVCEVNAEPPNPASDAFHAALGFTEVGSAVIDDGRKTVRYLMLPLQGGGDMAPRR